MKKFFYSTIVALAILTSFSCSDMLDSESSQQSVNPTLNAKSDSVYYAYGVLQAMQQLADQYYFQNELRGDLVNTTDNANMNLRNLANYSAGVENRYDSIYLYYKVINNCNYYLKNRNTELRDGSSYVVRNEYVSIAAIRAWTYLQMGRQYGCVPYVTEPVTTIEQINTLTSPENFESIFNQEIAFLEGIKSKYADYLDVPTFNRANISMGNLNWSRVSKFYTPSKCFIPLNVVLGDLYLETNQYDKAINCYYEYLKSTVKYSVTDGYNNSAFSVNFTWNYDECSDLTNSFEKIGQYSPFFKDLNELKGKDYSTKKVKDEFKGSQFINNVYSVTEAQPGDVISYIPMGVNRLKGQITSVPEAFGYMYYSTNTTSNITTNATRREIPGLNTLPPLGPLSVVPSKEYIDMASNQPFYVYLTEALQIEPYNDQIESVKCSDLRASILYSAKEDASQVYTFKPATGYVYLYRNTTVWLHLAEALNRAGYPDAAFAILKNGIQKDLADFRHTVLHSDDKYYITPETYAFLETNFLSSESLPLFTNPGRKTIVGIHSKGAGCVSYLYSPYKYNTVVGKKIDEMNDEYSLGKSLTTSLHADYYSGDENLRATSKQLAILAVEELLCEEYAMEFCFEGTRYSDLRRIAIHRNADTFPRAGFGDEWMQKKLASKGAVNTKNCYLPYN